MTRIVPVLCALWVAVSACSKDVVLGTRGGGEGAIDAGEAEVCACCCPDSPYGLCPGTEADPECACTDGEDCPSTASCVEGDQRRTCRVDECDPDGPRVPGCEGR